jgi:glycosyltransferase involved in cell wall biosynthesis
MEAVTESPQSADTPDVSVILAVYNTMPYLTECLQSLIRQTIGHARMEIIAVNDGSTDESPAELERFAARYPSVVRVLHQANSGGPAAPSNRALDFARGRYVFFIGSDDYLGLEALERLVAVGDEFDADLVAGRMVGIGGRFVPLAIFAETNTDVNLYESELPFAMSNTKLFRRSLIETYRIRYPEDMPMLSDQPFTVAAAVRAKRIVVLADYDYYYAIKRRNKSNITYSTTHELRLTCARRVMEENASILEPGPRRDAVLRRSFTSELGKLTRPDFLKLDRPMQELLIEGIGKLADQYLTEAIRMRLDAPRRLRISLAQRGMVDETLAVIERNIGAEPSTFVRDETGLYLDYPFFRDDRELPDAWFFVTDKPHEMMAHQLSVEVARWSRNGSGEKVLTVRATSPFGPEELTAARIGATVGRLKAHVRVTAGTDGGPTAVVFEWPVRDLIAESPQFGGRLDVIVDTSDGDKSYRVALRLPGNVQRPKKLARIGIRGFMIKPAKQPEREFAVDYKPATATEIRIYLVKYLRRRAKRALGRLIPAQVTR